MRTFKCSPVILGILSLASAFAATGENSGNGGKEGHGGDVVICHTTLGDYAYAGTYVLDFLVASEHRGFQIRKQLPDDGEIKLMVKELKAKSPELGLELEKYAEYFSKYKDKTIRLSGPVFWDQARDGLTNLPDENLRKNLPANCSSIKQAIRREVRGDQIIFYYDPNVLKWLEKGNQMNWLIVHEWLWDHLEDAEMIREVNEYLHSEEFLRDDKDTAIQNLEKLGLKDVNNHSLKGPTDVVVPTDQIQKYRDAVMLELDNRCENLPNLTYILNNADHLEIHGPFLSFSTSSPKWSFASFGYVTYKLNFELADPLVTGVKVAHVFSQVYKKEKKNAGSLEDPKIIEDFVLSVANSYVCNVRHNSYLIMNYDKWYALPLPGTFGHD